MKLVSSLRLLVLVFLASIVTLIPHGASFAQVSDVYLPNHGLNETWENVMTNFVNIQGSKRA